ncbi:stage V sporulation protein AF [Pullulanibacillus pueri]|uniref:Stage V sporulation protein AF n=1 Tax=Pullulanibacillus pueri TaxID=1437324 RepID=A0A8J2ZUN2_9BACL|nr:spore germination protein [Pullulanibacillus pueri]MBM7681516.1 stage V sporulation protein AF [Pullulanibacillus pueri]GGH79192.1 stage V sporulation protein AF [Pullulanibacillus pueri]
MPLKAENDKEQIKKRIKENKTYLEERVGVGTSFDVGVREMKILGQQIEVVYCNSLVDSLSVIELLRELLRLVDLHKTGTDVKEVIKNHLAHEQVTEIKTLDEAVDNMLSGLIVIFIDGQSIGLVVDTRHYPGRQPAEPDIERVVRGSKDGFTENIIENIGLIRRRIRDERFRTEMLKVGERSKTDVSLIYLKDVADPGLVKALKKEIKKIEVDGIPMADKTIEEFVIKQGLNPYPLVRYTERPDVAAAHILEGHVLVVCDTSPSIIIFPTTFFHHVQHAEEYRQTPVVGGFLRWSRFIAILLSIFLVPLWLVLVMNPDVLPDWLNFLGPGKKDYHLPIVLQILMAEVGIEIIRMAAVHTPTSLSTALGLIAAVLIGQIAVQVGVFIPEVILYSSVSAIGAFATPSYELSEANKIIRILLIIIVAIFGVPGFMFGMTLLILYLARVKNLNTPFLWPFIPFYPVAMFNVFVRTSLPLARIRPSIVRPQNKLRQPKENNG